MSYNSVELIKSVVLLISGKQYNDNDYQYAATCLDNLLKSLNGSSEINNAFPIGHSTSLFIKTIVAFDCSALS